VLHSPRQPALVLTLLLAGACREKPSLDPVSLAQTGAIDPEVLALAQEKSEAVRRDPSNARLHGSLGLVYEANGLHEAAEKSFENAARLDPGEPLWRYHRAISLREVGRTDEATALLRECAAELVSVPAAQHRLGLALLDAGDLPGALAAFRGAQAGNPDQPEVLVGIAAVDLAQGDPSAAVPLLEQVLAADPGYKQAHYLLGLAFRALSRETEAADQLALGLDGQARYLDDPLSAELRTYLVNSVGQFAAASDLFAAGQYAASLALCERILKKQPDDKNVLIKAGAAALELARYDRAFELLNRALALDEAEYRVHTNLAECYLRSQRLDEAMQHADRAIELAPETARARTVRARILANRGRFEEAYVELKQAVQLNARNAMTHVALTEVCAQLGRTDEALTWCRSAVRLDPSYLPARFNLALLTLRSGDVDGAAVMIAELDRMAKDHPRVAFLKDELAKVRR